MGRYYTGDVEGKWWFGVQRSDTPRRFGGEETFVEYALHNGDDFKSEIKSIKDRLGDKLKTFDAFFEKENGYNEEMLMDFFKGKHSDYTKDNLTADLEEYADYKFGLDVAEYFKESGEDSCYINSEM